MLAISTPTWPPIPIHNGAMSEWSDHTRSGWLLAITDVHVAHIQVKWLDQPGNPAQTFFFG